MPIEKSVDYIQASIDISEDKFRDENTPQITPTKFYKRGYRDTNGTRYFFGNPNSKKALVIMSGQALESIRNEGFEDKNIINSLILRSAKFTRIDLAVTQWNEDESVSLSDMQDYYKRGIIKSPLVARGGKLISDLELDGELYPETFYIGDLKKRAKKGLFRAYDKGKQLDISRYLMIRLELEERGENSHASALRIAENASIASVFRSRFDIEDEKFQRIIDAPSVKIQRGIGKKNEDDMSEDEKRWRWLIEQVAPTLKKSIKLDKALSRGDENIVQFILASGLSEELEKAATWIAKYRKIVDNEAKE